MKTNFKKIVLLSFAFMLFSIALSAKYVRIEIVNRNGAATQGTVTIMTDMMEFSCFVTGYEIIDIGDAQIRNILFAPAEGLIYDNMEIEFEDGLETFVTIYVRDAGES